MDTIRFELKHPNEVAILINDRDLIEMLREVELPFATREGHPSMAGDYQGLSPAALFEDTRVWLGKARKGWNYAEGQIVLLGCPYVDVYCWPMSVRVTLAEDRIIWSDFEQQQRDASTGEDQWTYEALGPFAFDRRQYMREVERMVSRYGHERPDTEP